MANSTFSGAVRSENGFTKVTKDATTGVITDDSTYSTAATVSGMTTTTGGLNGMTAASWYNQGVGTTMLGMNPQWNQNFGRCGDDGAPTTALKLALALEGVANQTAVPTAAQASAIFGGTGVIGTDFTIAAGATQIAANQSIVRYNGDVGSTLALTASTTDLASDTHKSLIIFNDNVFTASQALTLQVHTNNELDASSFEAFVTGAGNGVLEREATTTDGHAKIILTASGADTTILAGSYIYFEAAADTDSMVVKMMIRTTGGTIAVTSANN